ncbi:deoxynucleoside kinase [Arsenicibacter rosenii]|uniref:Deoxynucleoside kinase n=1 Tax=Arsenicibacter rosenii TaxID=1750698 RepID=A0A1S2VEX8_9BACT|nr:deoxynucleoside kinase [Arsenicibacter rosenii]OIN57311.1 deoxynucleoside kinase [Arsenicibacter rosenii]
MHVAITGNIGAGKTTLAQMLANHYGWDVLFEAVEGNPYLADFYGDMERWAFNLQIYFLNSRFEQVKTIRDSGKSVIQDRTIYEDAFIFAKNLYETGQMTPRDYETYRGLFENMLSLVRPPDLMIYLRADLPKLVRQIQKRGRSYEMSISEDYLASLNDLYEQFAVDYKVGELLIIDVNELNYAERPDDFRFVTKVIDEHLASRVNARTSLV